MRVSQLQDFVLEHHSYQLLQVLRHAAPDLPEEEQFSIITKAVRRQAEASLVLPLRRFLVWTLAPVRRVSQRLRRRLVALQKMPPENLQLDPCIRYAYTKNKITLVVKLVKISVWGDCGAWITT